MQRRADTEPKRPPRGPFQCLQATSLKHERDVKFKCCSAVCHIQVLISAQLNEMTATNTFKFKT